MQQLNIVRPMLKAIKNKEEGKDQESIQSSSTPDPGTQANTTHKKAKRLALSQQVITRLTGAEETA